MCTKAIERFGNIEECKIRVGGIPIKPDNNWSYMAPFSPTDVIVSAKCKALQDWLKKKRYNVHSVVYDEIVKMGGLLRCTTMPLKRL